MNRQTDVNAEIEFELPQHEDGTFVMITGVVVANGWNDLPDDCWVEDLEVLFDDGSMVPVDMVDLHGRKVWDVAADHAVRP